MYTKAHILSSFEPSVDNGDTPPFRKEEVVLVRRTDSGFNNERVSIDPNNALGSGYIAMSALLTRSHDVTGITNLLPFEGGDLSES